MKRIIDYYKLEERLKEEHTFNIVEIMKIMKIVEEVEE